MDKYADLRDALASDAYVYRSTAIRALLAERDALMRIAAEAVELCAADYPDFAREARSALAQEEL